MLHVVATPIGNNQDITLRALDILKKCPVVITEERKIGAALLRSYEIKNKTFFELNEHTDKNELLSLLRLCQDSDVALISDCGTPGFCDPGSALIDLCRKSDIPVKTYPGASSLMTLLSLTGIRLEQFYFCGFLPQKSELRQQKLHELSRIKDPLVLMDTPYRFEKTCQDIQKYFPNRKCLLGINLTQETEAVYSGNTSHLTEQKFPKKAEFIALIYP